MFNEVKLGASLFLTLDNDDKLFFNIESRNSNSLLSRTLSSDKSADGVHFGLGYEHESLDDPINPLRGSQFKADISFGDKKVTGNNSEGMLESQTVEHWQGQATLSRYFKAGNRSVLKISATGGHQSSDIILDKERYRIGGAFSLRGADEQSIAASTFVIGTIEYRLLTSDRSYFGVFYDQAYTESVSENSRYSDRPYGIGLGTSFETEAGLFNLSYALGSRFNEPLSLTRGKIHFGYAAVF